VIAAESAAIISRPTSAHSKYSNVVSRLLASLLVLLDERRAASSDDQAYWHAIARGM
jgi:hypothetical protein